MIKMGKIQNSTSTFGVAEKPFVPYGKKREGGTSATTVVRARALAYQVPYQQVATVAPVQPIQKQSFTIPIQPQKQQQQQCYQQLQ